MTSGTGSPALAGKAAIVTGASSGIGAATARALAREGAAVTLVARRAERLEELVGDIEAEGGRALAAPADVTDLEALRGAAARTVDSFGGIDVLVNNAGVMPLSPVPELDVDGWTRMIDVNVKGVLHGVAAVLPTMLEQGSGDIVNVGSVAGRRPFPGATIYSATKFAVRALTWGMHLELGSAHGIRLTDIQPGMVETELLDHVPDAVRESFRERWQGKRKLGGEDVARAIVFAVSSPPHVAVSEVLVRPTDQPT